MQAGRPAKGKDRGSAAGEGAEGRGTAPKGQGKKYGQGEGNMLRICWTRGRGREERKRERREQRLLKGETERMEQRLLKAEEERSLQLRDTTFLGFLTLPATSLRRGRQWSERCLGGRGDTTAGVACLEPSDRSNLFSSLSLHTHTIHTHLSRRVVVVVVCPVKPVERDQRRQKQQQQRGQQ